MSFFLRLVLSDAESTEKNSSVTTKIITMDVKNVSTINIDIEMVSINYLQKKLYS